VQDGRIYIEKLNGPFLFGDKGTPAEYTAGLDLAIARGWIELHDSGTFVKSRKAARICSPDIEDCARHHGDAPAQQFSRKSLTAWRDG
jgi:hypothetical protein